MLGFEASDGVRVQELRAHLLQVGTEPVGNPRLFRRLERLKTHEIITFMSVGTVSTARGQVESRAVILIACK